MRVTLSVFTLAIVLSPGPATADITTFNVDLSGKGSSTGHELRVFGTITLDPDLDVDTAIQSTSLTFQHEADLYLLPSIPGYGFNFGATLDWEVDGSDLYITRTSELDGIILFLDFPTPSMVPQFFLASGTEPHQLYFESGVVNPHIDTYDLKPPSGPDGPFGFLVGTAVPEPMTSVVLGGLLAFACTALRRSRISANYVGHLNNISSTRHQDAVGRHRVRTACSGRISVNQR